MNQEEAIVHFLETSARDEYHKSLESLEKYYLANRDQLADGFKQAFCQLYREISHMQTQGRKDKIAYIHCSFLYTSLLEGTNQYRLEAFDHTWYLDKKECVVYYDASWAYSFLHELGRWMNIERKKYVGRITSYDIELIKRMESFKYGLFVESLARSAIKQAVASPEFAAIAKEDFLHIAIGEYKDQSQEIYRYDIRSKDVVVIKEELEQKYPKQYVAEVWENLNFSHMKFDQLDLRYVRFTGSTMNQTAFQSTLLWETDFTHTHIAETDFSYSQMPGADFSYAQMQESQLSYIDGSYCDLTRGKWIGSKEAVSFYKAELTNIDFTAAQLKQASFQQASLSNCNFQSSCLQGADFTEVKLKNCNFTYAKLAGTKFSVGTNLDQLGLNEQQQQGIILV